MTSFRPRDFVLARVFVLEVMTDLEAYRFEPERVPNAEDSENEEVNDHLIAVTNFYRFCIGEGKGNLLQ